MINIRTQISTNETKERNKHKPEKALIICGKKNKKKQNKICVLREFLHCNPYYPLKHKNLRKNYRSKKMKVLVCRYSTHLHYS